MASYFWNFRRRLVRYCWYSSEGLQPVHWVWGFPIKTSILFKDWGHRRLRTSTRVCLPEVRGATVFPCLTGPTLITINYINNNGKHDNNNKHYDDGDDDDHDNRNSPRRKKLQPLELPPTSAVRVRTALCSVGGAWIIRCIFERLSQICPKRPFRIHCSWMFKFHWPQKTDRYDRLLWVKETLRLFMFCRVFTLHRCCFQFSCSLGVFLTKTHVVGECKMII